MYIYPVEGERGPGVCRSRLFYLGLDRVGVGEVKDLTVNSSNPAAVMTRNSFPCKVFTLIIVYTALPSALLDMKWEREVGEEMIIQPTTEGYRQVNLRCGAEHLEIEVETEDSFSGVIYTRGSYGKKNSPCFKDVVGGRFFNLRIPFDDCKTKNEGEVFTNTLILQHDDDLIMPGDAAFLLECSFTKPRDIPVHGSMPTELFDVISKISLSSADPTNRDIPDDLKMFVTNKSQIVSFSPKRLVLEKDEL